MGKLHAEKVAKFKAVQKQANETKELLSLYGSDLQLSEDSGDDLLDEDGDVSMSKASSSKTKELTIEEQFEMECSQLQDIQQRKIHEMFQKQMVCVLSLSLFPPKQTTKKHRVRKKE